MIFSSDMAVSVEMQHTWDAVWLYHFTIQSSITAHNTFLEDLWRYQNKISGGLYSRRDRG